MAQNDTKVAFFGCALPRKDTFNSFRRRRRLLKNLSIISDPKRRFRGVLGKQIWDYLDLGGGGNCPPCPPPSLRHWAKSCREGGWMLPTIFDDLFRSLDGTFLLNLVTIPREQRGNCRFTPFSLWFWCSIQNSGKINGSPLHFATCRTKFFVVAICSKPEILKR